MSNEFIGKDGGVCLDFNHVDGCDNVSNSLESEYKVKALPTVGTSAIMTRRKELATLVEWMSFSHF